MNLSASQLSLWHHNIRCWFWRYIRRLSPKEEQEKLAWGSALHECLDKLYKNEGVENIYKWIRENPEFVWMDEHEWRDRKRLIDVLENYIPTISEDFGRYKILHTETNWALPLDKTGHSWVGVLDLVCEDRNTGLIHILDHKSTTKNIHGSNYFESYSWDVQMSGYTWMGKRLFGDQFDGVQINAFQSTKTIPFRTQRVVVSRDDWQLDEFELEAADAAEEIEACMEVHNPKDGKVSDSSWVPFIECYGENFCDYRHLNRIDPDSRESLVDLMYFVRPETEEVNEELSS